MTNIYVGNDNIQGSYVMKIWQSHGIIKLQFPGLEKFLENK